jgi:predicted enzyme related to lactoylglutathione lyase
MISGGNVTVFVSDMNRAVRFYTEVLELKLASRYGDDWATVDVGKGLTIGLHPASPKYPAPGAKGAIVIGLEVDDDIDRVVRRLRDKGVPMDGSITRDEVGNFAHLEDPDGNRMYLWEVRHGTAAAGEAASAGSRQR